MKRFWIGVIAFCVASLVLIYIFIGRHSSSPKTETSASSSPQTAIPSQNPPQAPAAQRRVAQENIHPRQAQRPSLRQPQAQEKNQHKLAQFLTRYASGSSISLKGSEYQILNLRAIPKDRYNTSMGPVEFERMNQIFIASSDNSISQMIVGDSQPVLAKKSNGMVSLVTGTLLVTLKNANTSLDSTAQNLAQIYHLTLLQPVDADLKLAALKASPGSSLVKLFTDLQADPSVASVRIETLQSFKGF
jgi:hypothetical protein